MRICILCEESKVSTVRENMRLKSILTVPLSANGQLPVTHWFCSMAVTEERASKLLALAKLTTMEIAEPKDFLEKWNLKIIE